MNNSAIHKEGKIGRMIGTGLGTGLGMLIGMPGLGAKVGGMLGGGIGQAVDNRQQERGTGPYADQQTAITPVIQGQAPADEALTVAQGHNPIAYKNNSIGKPHQAAMMLGISNGLMPKGAMLG